MSAHMARGKGPRVTRHRRGLPAAVGGALLALVLVVVGLPKPASQAAQGQLWLSGVPYAGVLETDTARCSATVVSEFLAITAKSCGTVNPRVKLDVASAKEPGHDYRVKEIILNRDLDVEAIVLRDRSGLTVTPLRAAVESAWFYVWGYGLDWSNNDQEHLTRADFNQPEPCPENAIPGRGSTACAMEIRADPSSRTARSSGCRSLYSDGDAPGFAAGSSEAGPSQCRICSRG
jgi:hypothetical protein